LTHTLHRFRIAVKPSSECKGSEASSSEPAVPNDFITMVMACQGFNQQNAEVELRQILKLLEKHEPVNLADDNWGGIYTGETVDGIMEKMIDTAYIAAVFEDPRALVAALRDLKDADLGMSVVVTGDPGQIWPLIREAGLAVHTINVSLGVFGNPAEMLPEPVLALTTMCGHGLISPAFARDVARRVAAGRLDPRDGALELASLCTCGMFNVASAEKILAAGALSTDEAENQGGMVS